MSKFFLFVFFLCGTSMTAWADSIEVRTSMSKLFAQGFTNGRSETYGFQRPESSEFTMEFYLLYTKGRKIDTSLYYKWLDGNILYRVLFLSKEYANTCVFALVFDEDVTVEDYSRGGNLEDRARQFFA